jgi:Protein of unknown function (DUF2934)
MPKSPSSGKPTSSRNTPSRAAQRTLVDPSVRGSSSEEPEASARKSVNVPLEPPRKVTLVDREQRIRDRAYAIWEYEGRPDGQSERHWRLAEQAIAKIEEGAVSVDPAGVPLTEKQTNESSDVAGSPYAPPEPGPV